MRRLFEGESGAIRDNVILNTAAGLLACNKVKDIKEGILKPPRILIMVRDLKN